MGSGRSLGKRVSFTMKSPAQVLFERLIRTWIGPDVIARQKQNAGIGPIPLRIALIVWKQPNVPTVLLNDEVFGQVRKMEVVAPGPVQRGQPVTSADIKGIQKVVLTASLASYPYVLVVQGRDEKFYVASHKMSEVVTIGDFEVLAPALSTEGVILAGEGQFRVFLDLLRNGYEAAQAPAQKRRKLAQLAALHSTSKADARAKARRHLRLPTLIIHAEDEFLPLLLEARTTYIDGHFFSCVASSVTTADRICIRLMQRVGLPEADTKKIVGMTFGQKIQPLRSKQVITTAQERLLARLNRIRNKHVHPRKSPSALTTKRDALASVQLLHEFLEGTFSVFRDYTIEEGRLVPKPLT